MSQYTKTTNFASKDNLSPGNPLKIVKGTEIDTEFNNIQTAVATKTDNSAANITGGSITGITDLAVADGGTGASTATAALNNLLPTQTGNANKYLQTDGTNATWDAVTLSTADITGTLPVANGGTGVTASTGTGSVVLSNSPTLVTPALGTPASGTATNLTGLPISTGVSGLGTGVATFLGTPSSANLASAVTDETGSGALVFANSPTLVTPDLGTPSALVGTNITGTASGLTAGNVTTNANLTGAVTSVGNATSLGSFSSANLLGALTDETGTGSAVFATSPTLVTPILGTPTSATLTNATGLPISTGVSGLGTGVATALAVNVGSSGAPLVNGGVLGTPSSGTVTNLTGTASININGTVGATTASTGEFTTLSATGVTTVQAGSAAAPAITTTGDTNTGIWFPAADTIAFTEGGAESMRINASGDVGIGTSSPSSFGTRLAVSGAANVYGDERKVLAVIDTTSLATGVGAGVSFFGVSESGGGVSQFGSIKGIKENATSGNYAGALAFVTSNSANTQTQRMLLDSAGSLGIGTSSPTVKLDITGYETRLLAPSSGKSISLYADANSSAIGYLSSGYLVFGKTTSTITTQFTEQMRLDSAGNLGLGTNAPNTYAKLAVRGYVTTGSVNYSGLFSDAVNSSLYIGHTSTTVNFLADTAITFGTGSPASFTERARITSGGDLCVGATSSTSSKLFVKGANTGSSEFALRLHDSADTVLFYARNDGYIQTGGATNSPYNLTTASAANLWVGSNGELRRSTSSLKYKTDVQDATHGLAKVLALRPVTYKGKNDGDTVFGGLIAEEVHAAGLTEFVQYAEDGSPDALAYGQMVSLAFKAIQEQQAIIESLKARLDAANL